MRITGWKLNIINLVFIIQATFYNERQAVGTALLPTFYVRPWLHLSQYISQCYVCDIG
jgi:hypothetical protein